MDDNLIERRREAFEAWDTASFGSDPEEHEIGADGKYIDGCVEQCWLAWNAALDSAVVEIDTTEIIASDDYTDGYADATQAICDAIERAGLRVKS